MPRIAQHIFCASQVKYGMPDFLRKKTGRTATFAVLLAAIIFICAVALSACANSAIRIRAKFYFVCCTPAAAQSYEEMCSILQNAGWAGFELDYGGSAHAVAAVCSTTGEAQSLCDYLSATMAESYVLTAERLRFYLETYGAESNAEQYKYVLETLISLCSEVQDCTEVFLRLGEGEAKERLRYTYRDTADLLAENGSNCFTPYLVELTSLAADCLYGDVLFARELRYLASATAYAVLKVELR